MKTKFGLIAVMSIAPLLLVASPLGRSGLAPMGFVTARSEPEVIEASADCADCESRCDSWVRKCKEGGQYACYKAAACLCKCNLDEGGCGSSKEALRECYEQNEKLARELGPEK